MKLIVNYVKSTQFHCVHSFLAYLFNLDTYASFVTKIIYFQMCLEVVLQHKLVYLMLPLLYLVVSPPSSVAQAGVLGFVGCAWVIMIVALVAHRIRSARKMDEDPMA